MEVEEQKETVPRFFLSSSTPPILHHQSFVHVVLSAYRMLSIPFGLVLVYPLIYSSCIILSV